MSTQRGFTLIELMIVVVIIGILAAITIPMVSRMIVNAKEASTKTNMHTLQVSAEDYGVQHDGVYAASMDAATLAGLLPSSFRNPFSGTHGEGDSWEDRAAFSAAASPVKGIVSYADSASGYIYNIKGHGKDAAINVVLTYGR